MPNWVDIAYTYTSLARIIKPALPSQSAQIFLVQLQARVVK